MQEIRNLKRTKDYTIGDKDLEEPIYCPIRGPKMSCIALCAFYAESVEDANLNHGKKRIVHCKLVDKVIGSI